MISQESRNDIHTLEDVHRSVTNLVADLEGISEGLDLREPFLEVFRSLLDRLLLRLHQVERVATLSANRGLQRRDGVFKERIANVTNTGGVIAVCVIVGKRAPLRSRVNDFIANLCQIWSVSEREMVKGPTHHEPTSGAHHVAAAEFLGQIGRELLAVWAHHDVGHLFVLLVVIVGASDTHRGRSHVFGVEGGCRGVVYYLGEHPAIANKCAGRLFWCELFSRLRIREGLFDSLPRPQSLALSLPSNVDVVFCV